MTKITDKLKEKVIEAKDKVVETKDKVTDTTKEKAKDAKDKVVETKDKVTDTSKDTIRDTSVAGTKVSTKGDSTREYETREPMSPSKIKEHEPTAVKREMTEKITQGGKRATNQEEAKEIARRSGMAKGTVGAEETSEESESDTSSGTVE
ncbi:MAG: hypothetical protein M3044_05510 [Thermoproteota archaeon]|nr:hypothetical protein [Thermoproteota archaeon]